MLNSTYHLFMTKLLEGLKLYYLREFPKLNKESVVSISEWKKKCWTFKKLFIHSCTCNHLFCWPHSRVVWSIGHIYRLRLLPDTGRQERTSCRWLPLHCLSPWSPAELHCSHWLCIDESSCPISDHKYVNLLTNVSTL